MKRLIFILSLLLIIISSYSQDYVSYGINFDDPSELFRLEIDSLNGNNIWQIGKPRKTIFNSAFSPLNAIVTDTSDFYPINNYSSFTLVHRAASQGAFVTTGYALFSGKYYVNTDTINDFGLIEFSFDKGTTWIDLLNDSIYIGKGYYQWVGAKPILTGCSLGWVEFNLWLGLFDDEFHIEQGDTILLRFSFLSDGIEDNKDGLMFDDFLIIDIGEGIEANSRNFKSSAFPNPATSMVKIEFDNHEMETHSLKIFNQNDQEAYLKDYQTNTGFFEIGLGHLPGGVYFYQVRNLIDGKISSGSFIKN